MKAKELLGIMAIFSLLCLFVSWSEAGQPIKPNPSTVTAFSD